jgi:hypothetical protein
MDSCVFEKRKRKPRIDSLLDAVPQTNVVPACSLKNKVVHMLYTIKHALAMHLNFTWDL